MSQRRRGHGEPVLPGIVARLFFALSMRAFPRSARDRFGESMRETFVDCWADAGAGRVRRIFRVAVCTADMVRGGLLERARAAGARRRTRGGQARRSGMSSLVADVRFALRALTRAPSFTAVAVLTLALGIGATTTIFSVLEGVLLRPWPFPESSRLVVPFTWRPATDDRWSVNYADYEDWRAAEIFEELAVFDWPTVDLSAPGGDPERVNGVRHSEDFFRTLRVRPVLGRLPAPEEYSADAAPVVLLSHGFWRTRFAADPAIVGSTIRLAGSENTVIGVLAPEADVLEAAVFVPQRPSPETLAMYRDRDNFAFSSVARLAPGRDMESSRAMLRAVAHRIEQENAALRAGTSADIMPLARWVVGDDVARILWLALGAVGVVLLIGCANLANLLLARGVRRERELAVRAALGAGRGRLVVQLMVENLVLAALGGAAGVLLAAIAVRAMVARAPLELPRLDGVGLNPSVLGFALALALASAVLFGMLPALRSTVLAGARVLGDRGAGEAGLRGRRWRAAVTVAEVALTVVLLAGAGLMLRSLRGLMAVEPGFETENLVTFLVSLPSSRYPERENVLIAHEELRSRLAAVPGVIGVAQASQLPLGAAPGYLTRAYLPEGGAEPPAGTEVTGPWEVVTPGYFGVMRQAVPYGREFTSADTGETAPVMIVNREFARRMFGAEADALGRRVRSWRDENVYREIVGVVDDVRYFGAGDEIRPVAYVPLRQDSRRGVMVVVRTARDPAALVPALRGVVRDFDRDLAAASFTTMRQAFDASIAARRFAASLLATFAALALLLAGLGVYGVLSVTVAQRTREFGVRMALGAAAGQVRGMVLREAAVVLALGAALGVAGALIANRALSAVLYEVSATDPVTFGGVVATLLALGLVATWLPARRATRVDPVQAIRAE